MVCYPQFEVVYGFGIYRESVEEILEPRIFAKLTPEEQRNFEADESWKKERIETELQNLLPRKMRWLPQKENEDVMFLAVCCAMSGPSWLSGGEERLTSFDPNIFVKLANKNNDVVKRCREILDANDILYDSDVGWCMYEYSC